MLYSRIVITRFGGPEVLHNTQAEVPQPQRDEVRVRLLAAGVSFNEVMQREGVYKNAALRIPNPPFTPGYDICGIVDQLGVGVSPELLGQRVVALPGLGGYADYLCLAAREVVPVPAGVDSAEAVSLVLNYVTAYQMLHRMAKVTPGEKVLIHGAAGGVGTALLDLGRLAGLTMYGTASSAKHATVTRLGGYPIDYRKDDFVARIRALTDTGVDAVFDCFGGTISTRSYQLLRERGRLILFGDTGKMVGGRQSSRGNFSTIMGLGTVLAKNLLWWRSQRVSFYGINVLKKDHPDWFHSDLTALLLLLGEGKIKPQIAQRLPLTEARRAHELLSQGAIEGKLVLLGSDS